MKINRPKRIAADGLCKTPGNFFCPMRWHHMGVEPDPLLKELINQGSNVDEQSVPLTLYTPFGRVSGYTTTGDDFHRYSAAVLAELSEVRTVFNPEGLT